MIASPCTGVCTLNPENGLCLGCLRTTDEIACWGTASDALRLDILERILEREAQGCPRIIPADD